jgi:hypothetical protein
MHHHPALLYRSQAYLCHCWCQEHCWACHVWAKAPVLPVLLQPLLLLPYCQAWRGACCSLLCCCLILLLLLLPA